MLRGALFTNHNHANDNKTITIIMIIKNQVFILSILTASLSLYAMKESDLLNMHPRQRADLHDIIDMRKQWAKLVQQARDIAAQHELSENLLSEEEEEEKAKPFNQHDQSSSKTDKCIDIIGNKKNNPSTGQKQ
jgi:hypothetical protein